MRKIYRFGTFAVLAAMIATGSNAKVPEWIAAPPGTGPTPIWATPDQVTNANGKLRSELFRPFEAKRIEKRLEKAREARQAAASAGTQDSDACQSWTFIPPSSKTEERSLEALLSQAQLALIGTVVDRREGFYHGFPTLSWRFASKRS